MRAPGLFLAAGLASWPESLGVALSVGAFHNRLVGVEVSSWVPVTAFGAESQVVTALVGRLTVLREPLGSSPAPFQSATAELVLSVRAGFAMILQPASDEALLGLAIGPAADIVLFGTLLVSLRPLVAIVPDSETGQASLPLRPFPLLELSLGIIAGDSCGGGLCGW